ncbi:MAG: SufD family Fe-S cluster assembly protein, partial [Traorella sp.]
MEKMVLKDGSLEKITIADSKEIMIQVKKNTSCSLYILLKQNVDVTCKINIEEDGHADVLFWNESDSCKFYFESHLQQDASLNLNLGELYDGETNNISKIYLDGEGAKLNLRSASCVASKKYFDIECIHAASHSESQMENYAIIYENADYKMIDTGTIKKGAYGSNSHQATRALVLSDSQKCSITPVLLIDENDVQASHATTMGQIDENQLYYLQTRGLTKTQALGLITVGYLMPIAS